MLDSEDNVELVVSIPQDDDERLSVRVEEEIVELEDELVLEDEERFSEEDEDDTDELVFELDDFELLLVL